MRKHHAKRIQTSVILLGLVAIMISAAWFGWQGATTVDSAGDDKFAPCAPTAPTAPPAPQSIQLNVYNATNRTGLASSVAKQLRDRGFSVLEVNNDPLNRKVHTAAEIRSSPTSEAAAKLVASMVPGAAYVEDTRGGPEVDLVLGDTFTTLTAPGTPAAPAENLPKCT